jgi:hypothetical protein
MALTSTSTRANALAQYNDNLTWEGNAAKAALALEAIRWLLVNRPLRIAEGSRSLDYESLLAEKEKLESFVKLSSSAIDRASFVQGRMLT